MKIQLIPIWILVALVLAGCERPFGDIGDTELADDMHACRTSTEQSPGFAIRCDNVARECAARREEGRFVC